MARIIQNNQNKEEENDPSPRTGKTMHMRESISAKASLTMPVSRVRRNLKKGKYADRIQIGSSVYLTAVLEYLCAEIMELSGETAKQHRKKRITPRFLTLAIRMDTELNELLRNVTIAEGGIVPFIQPVLLTKNNMRLKRVAVEDD